MVGIRHRDAKAGDRPDPGEIGFGHGGCPMSENFACSAVERKTGMQSTSPARSELFRGTQAVTNWKKEWFDIEDATYLNTAAHTVMPRVSIRAVERSLEAKKFPHRVDDSLWFEAPVRIRTSLAKMIGGKPEEIAVTTGASTGAAAVAHSLQWKPGDEIITAQGEFPLHYATWKPMEEREGVRLRVIAPRDRFITADDLIDALTPRTRIVSVSLVRYDDGTLLDAARISAACHAQGTLLLLDVSQACGAVPMSVKDLGADFMVCAGYKWLLSCYGTGFFWIKTEHLDGLLPGPFCWTGQNTDHFSELNFVNPKPSRNAKRWDAAEWATYYNFNLSAMAESVDFVLRRPATCRRAQPESYRIYVSSSPRGSLYSRKSAGVWKTRAVWMLHSAQT